MTTRKDLIDVVREHSHPITENFGLPVAYEEKGDGSDAAAAVTCIDRAVQNLLMERLRGDFIGEEEDGGRVSGADYVWYCDPLDGTGARIRSIPVSMCIATMMHMKGGRGYPIMTVMHNPISDQTWSAAQGGGAWYSFRGGPEVRLKLDSNASVPKRALCSITHWPGSDFNFGEVKRAVEADARFDNQNVGALGTAHAIVATGTSHLSACRAGTAFETVAATLLIQEAGGVAWDLIGNPLMEQGFPLEAVDGKHMFTIPKGAIIASSTAVAAQFLEVVHVLNPHS